MNERTVYFNLGLDQQSAMEYVNVRRGDTETCLSVGLSEGGASYELAEGVSAVLAAQKSDGTYITPESCTISKNRLIVKLSAAITGTSGRVKACFALSGGSAAISTPDFTILVSEIPKE